MAELDHPTRLALLDAGLALAEHKALSSVSVDDVVRQASVAKGTFYVHFGDRGEFMVALHERFHDHLRERIAAASAGRPPGADRLRRSTVAYLDGCLEMTGVKAMLVGARGDPAITDRVSKSNDRFSRAGVGDFTAIGARYPLATSRLFVAMVAEVALLELEKGRADRTLRAALWELAGVGAG